MSNRHMSQTGASRLDRLSAETSWASRLSATSAGESIGRMHSYPAARSPPSPPGTRGTCASCSRSRALSCGPQRRDGARSGIGEVAGPQTAFDASRGSTQRSGDSVLRSRLLGARGCVPRSRRATSPSGEDRARRWSRSRAPIRQAVDVLTGSMPSTMSLVPSLRAAEAEARRRSGYDSYLAQDDAIASLRATFDGD